MLWGTENVRKVDVTVSACLLLGLRVPASSGTSLGCLGPNSKCLCLLYASVCWLLSALDSSSSVVHLVYFM